MQGLLLGGSAGQAGAAAQHIHMHASCTQGCRGAASQVPEGVRQSHHYPGHACMYSRIAEIKVTGSTARASAGVFATASSCLVQSRWT